MKQQLTLIRSMVILIAVLMTSTPYVFAQGQLGTNSNSNAIDSTGNVGIGITNPTHKLEVVGSSKFTGTMEVDSASVFNDSIIMMSSRVEEDLIVEGNIIMRKYIDESTILPKSLVVKQDGEIATQDEVYCVGPDAQGNYFASWSYDPNIIYTYCDEQVFKVGINTDKPQSALDVRGNQYLSGKLGIGINNPAQKLAVIGNQYLSGKLGIGNNTPLCAVDVNTGTETYSLMKFTNSNGTLLELDDEGNQYIKGNVGIGVTNPNLKFEVDGSQYLSGKLGIGVTPSDYELDVNGDQFLSGKLGIGVTPSDYKLDVNGNQHISGLLTVETEDPYNNQKLLSLNYKNGTAPFRSMFFVSKTDGWPTPIAEDGDFGIFWNDNEGSGDNQVAGFTIAPSGYLSGVETGLRITSQGWVGIGKANPQSMLAVNGKITAKEVEVTLTGFPDFVFQDDFKLLPLAEVEQFIKTHKHLPDVPDEKTVIENGLNLGEMDALLLQKVEELTLYVIELQKEIDSLKNK